MREHINCSFHSELDFEVVFNLRKHLGSESMLRRSQSCALDTANLRDFRYK